MFLTASRRLAATMGFAWVGHAVTLHAAARKHPAVRAGGLLLPLLALSAGLGALAAGGLNASGLAAAAGAAVAAFGIAFGVWRALDWRNDSYIAPDPRAVWL